MVSEPGFSILFEPGFFQSGIDFWRHALEGMGLRSPAYSVAMVAPSMPICSW
jgi:hypothetical protein